MNQTDEEFLRPRRAAVSEVLAHALFNKHRE